MAYNINPALGNKSGSLSNGDIALTAAPTVGPAGVTLSLSWSTSANAPNNSTDKLVLALVNLTNSDFIIIDDSLLERSAGSTTKTVDKPGANDQVVYIAWFRNSANTAQSPNKVLGTYKAGTTAIW